MFYFPLLFERQYHKTSDQLWPCTQDVLLLFKNVRPALKKWTGWAACKEKEK